MEQRTQMERQMVSGITLLRKMYASQKNMVVLFEDPKEKTVIEAMAKRAFYPETVELEYIQKERTKCGNISGNSMENLALVYRYDRENDILTPCEQFGDLVDLRIEGKEQLVIDPFAADTGEKCEKIIVCGGVDDGKSTLLGRLIFEALEEAEQQRLIAEGRILRKDKSIDYALMTAESAEEEEQGITIEVTYSKVHTRIGTLIFADTPGHEQYTIHMAQGAAFADHAILMVAANQGIKDQTMKQLHICSLLGIRNFIVAINKMDLCHYEERVYNDMEHKILSCMERLPYDELQIVPVAAKKGDNIRVLSENMPWYHGLTLLESLQSITRGKDNSRGGSYFRIDRIVKPSQDPLHPIPRRVYAGRMLEGEFEPQDEVEVYPGKKMAEIRSIHNGEARQSENCKDICKGEDQQSEICEDICKEEAGLVAGESAAIELTEEIDIRQGSCLVKNMTFEQGTNMIAKIVWFKEKPLFTGKRLTMVYDNRSLGIRIKTIKGIEDIRTGAFLKSHSIEQNSISEVELHLDETICFAAGVREASMHMFLLLDERTKGVAGCGWFSHPVDQLADMETLSIEDKRRQLMGHKSFVLLCKESDDIEQIEEVLLGRGYHTMSLQWMQKESTQKIWQLESLLQAGMIVLISCKEEEMDSVKTELEMKFPGVIRSYHAD